MNIVIHQNIIGGTFNESILNINAFIKFMDSIIYLQNKFM